MRYVVLSAGLALAVVFAASAVSKLRGRDAYAAFVAATGRLLPTRALPRRPVALVVVAGEVAIPPLMVLSPAAGLTTTAVLSASFTVGILLAVHRGVRAPCRCFGASAAPLRRLQALRSGGLAVLAAVALGLLVGAGLTWSTGIDLLAGLHPAGVLLAAVAAVVLALLTIYFDDIAELFAPASTPVGGASAAERN